MLQVQSHLTEGDYESIHHLLSAYGGTSSLNGLVLAQNYENGVFSWKPGYRDINERFNKLRSRARELATEIMQSDEMSRS